MNTEQVAETSVRFKVKAAGAFYLLNILTGLFSEFFVNKKIILYGDAAATATNILAHEPLFRLGIAADLIMVACYVAVTALFYGLFRPVNSSLSLLAAFFSLVGCAIQAFTCLFHLAPMLILGSAHYLSVFKVDELQALALLSIKLYGQTYYIALVFFGLYCLLTGYVIFKSTFLPRLVGVLMAVAGLGWLAASFATFLSPPIAHYLYSYIWIPGLLGEGLVCLWLLVKGVNVQRWKEKAKGISITRD